MLKSANSQIPQFDAVTASIGDFGRWQLWSVFLLSFSRIPLAWQIMEIVFIAPPAQFHCTTPANITDKCAAECINYEFDTNIFINTIIMEWNLVCERAQYPNLMQMIFILGTIVGSSTFGYLADRFGRRKPTIIAVLAQSLTCILTAFVPNFWAFLVLRFISAIACGGTMLIGFVWVVELVGIKWRSTVTIVFQSVYHLGTFMLIICSYFFRDWRLLQMSLSFPTLVFLIYFWLPESPRWLIAVGKTDQAIKILTQAAEFNRLPTENISENVFRGCKIKSGEKSHKGNFFKLLRTSTLRVIFLCISIIWMITSLCGFGSTQYIGEIAGNIYINTTLSTLIQLPPIFFCRFFLKYLGRKYSLVAYLFISAMLFLLILISPEDKPLIAATFASLGMCFLTAGSIIFILFAGELFPTVARNVALGFSSTFGRTGGMVAPFVAGLASTYPSLPPIIFALALILGALITLKLPETDGKEMPDTFTDCKSEKNELIKDNLKA